MRLVDADALKYKMEVAPMYAVDMYTACDVIDAAPTVDAVEVVRCKDCKWCKRWKNAFGARGLECELLCIDTQPEAYCSHGERKEGEQDEDS